MKTKLTKLLTLLTAVGLASAAWADTMKITPAQKRYLQREVIAIVHWGLNTYTGLEWGDGTTDPLTTFPSTIGDTINPSQWVSAMKAGGIKEVILVAKHHDGFCLWPAEANTNYSTSAFATGHSFKNYDLIAQVSAACEQQGVDFGVYVSPWDRHHSNWGRTKDNLYNANEDYYPDYFQRHVGHIVTNYGEICEMWFDGATGDSGYYGGANESRTLPTDAKTYYDFSTIQKTLNDKWPLAVIFGGGCSNSVCWAGNELGNVPTDWSYDRGGYFGSPEADTPVGGSSTSSKGAWFWHSDHVPKSLKQMVKNYFESVGRGGVLNWGISPNQDGLIPDADVARLKEFGDYIKTYNASDVFNGATATTNTTATGMTVTLTMPEAKTFNAIDFGENLDEGQIVTSWTAEVRVDGDWQSFASGTKAGWRRIAKLDNTVMADAIRITATGATTPTIERIYVRNAATVKDDGSVDMGETDTAEWMTRDAEGYHPVTFIGNNPTFNMPTDLVKYEMEILFTNVTSQSSASSFLEVLKLTNASGDELKLSANTDAKLVLTSSDVAGSAAGTLVGSYGDSNHNVLSSAGWTTDETTTIRLLVRNDGERLSIYKDGVLIIRTDKNFGDEGQVKSVTVGGGLASLTGSIVSIRYREATRGSVDEILNAAYMWLDASDSTTILTNDSGAVTNWTSRNASGKAATSYTTSPVTGGPTVSTETLADMKYVDFGSAGSGLDLQFTRSTAVRTVFMVADVATGTQNVFFLGDSSGYKFHRGGSGQYFNATHGAPFLSGTYCNGEKVASPSSTQVPSGFCAYTLVASEAVPASRICQDRTESGRNGGKKIAELLIFEKVLTDCERGQVEDYLMEKWLGRKIYTAAVNGTQDFSALTWDPSKPSDFTADGVVTRLIATNGAATVNFASAQTIGNLRVDTAAGNLLSVANLNNLTATKLDLLYADEGLAVDATGGYEANQTWKDFFKANEVLFVFKGNGANGAKIEYTTNQSVEFKAHLVFEGGTHVFKYGMGSADVAFSTTGTLDNPTLFVKNGTTLNYTLKDQSGWNGSRKDGTVVRAESGATLNILPDGNSSMFMSGRMVLEPGSTTTYKTGTDGNGFCIYGGIDGVAADPTKAQLYVPAPTDNGGTVATLAKHADSNQNLKFAKASGTGGAAITVEEGATLDMTTPIGGAQNVSKYGAGTLKLSGSMDYTGTITATAGTLELGTTISHNANGTYAVNSGATLAFSDATATTIPKLTLNDGAILLPKNAVTVSGTLTASAFTLDATHLIAKATTAGTNEVVALTVTGTGTIPAVTITNGDGWMTVSSGTELKIVKLGSTGLRVSDMEAGKSYGLGANPTLTFDRKPAWTTSNKATLAVSGTLTLAGTVDVTPAMLNDYFTITGADTINCAWQTREVISINFGSSGTVSGDSSDSSLAGFVYGSSWNNFTDSSATAKSVPNVWNGSAKATLSGVTATWSCRAAYGGGGSYSAQFQKGYLDDGTGKEVTVSVAGIPYTKYSVIIYYSTDSTGDPKFHTPCVNTKYYTANKTTGVTSAVDSRGTWGVGKSVTIPKFGSNAIRIDDLTGDLSINAYKNATQRGTLAAIQIINTTEFVDYDADITAATATWSTKEGLSNQSATWENGSDNTISLFNKFDGSTLTFDSAVTAKFLSVVTPSDKSVTLATSNSATMTIASYDFEAADGEVTVDFATGASPVVAGADTILTQLGTGTITVGAGKKLTLKDGARSWDTSKITVDADGELVIGTGDTALTTVPFAGRASQYTAVAGVVTYAGNIETTTADDFQFAYSISRNFDTGCDISAPRMVNGNQKNVTQTFNQYDGEIEITGNGDMTASEQNAPILFAHWPSTVTNNIFGGSLTATSGVKGSIYFARDGNAVLNIGGGTATATLRTNGLIDDNRYAAGSSEAKDKSATQIEILTKGVFEIGQYGITMTDSREHFYLSGGTLAAYEDATVSVAGGIEVTDDTSHLAAAADTKLTIAAPLKGDGRILFIGGDGYTGTVAITNSATTLTGSLSLHPSATLEVPAQATSFNVLSTEGGTLKIILSAEQQMLNEVSTGVRAYGFNGTVTFVKPNGETADYTSTIGEDGLVTATSNNPVQFWAEITTATTNFSQLAWTPSTPSSYEGKFLTITANCETELTFDETVAAGEIKLVSSNPITVKGREKATAEILDFTAATGKVDLDVDGFEELAKNTVVGAPYSYWVFGNGITVKGDANIALPAMPYGYQVALQQVAGYGWRFVATAADKAKFGSININIGDPTFAAATEYGLYPAVGSDWFLYTSLTTTFVDVGSTGIKLSANNNNYGTYALTGTTDAQKLFKNNMNDSKGAERGFTLKQLNNFADKYRVIVYMSTDTANWRFVPIMIGGTSYAGPSSRVNQLGYTIKGSTANWGWANNNQSHHSFDQLEGVNAVISDVLTANELVIKCTRTNDDTQQARGSIAAIQVVKVGSYVDAMDFTADIVESTSTWGGGTGTGLANQSDTWRNRATDTLTLTATVASTFTIDQAITAASFAIVSEDGDAVTIPQAGLANLANVAALDFSNAEGGIVIDCTGLTAAEGIFFTKPITGYANVSGTNEPTGYKLVAKADGLYLYRADTGSRNNPVTGAAQNFDYAYVGEDGAWVTTANWRTLDRTVGIMTAYTGSLAPMLHDSDVWTPTLIDGALFANKTVSVETLEGYNARLAVLNGAQVTVGTIRKFAETVWFWVDATSKLTISEFGDQSFASGFDAYVANENGLTFSSELDDTHQKGGKTYNYYLAGTGTVNYAAGVTAGTHAIKQFQLVMGTGSNKIIKKQPLVTFAEKSGTPNFTWADVTVSADDGTTGFVALEAAPTLGNNFGDYFVSQEADGVYVTFVGKTEKTLLWWNSTDSNWTNLNGTVTATIDDTCILYAQAGDNITFGAAAAPSAFNMPATGTVSVTGYTNLDVTSLTIPEGAVLRLVVGANGAIGTNKLKETLALSGAGNVELYQEGYVNGLPVVDANFADDFTGRLVIRRGQFGTDTALKSTLDIQVTDGGNLHLKGGTWNNHFYLSGSGWKETGDCWDRVSLRQNGNQLGGDAVLEFITVDDKKGSIGNYKDGVNSTISCTLVGEDGFRIETGTGSTFTFDVSAAQVAGLSGQIDLDGGTAKFSTAMLDAVTAIKVAEGATCKAVLTDSQYLEGVTLSKVTLASGNVTFVAPNGTTEFTGSGNIFKAFKYGFAFNGNTTAETYASGTLSITLGSSPYTDGVHDQALAFADGKNYGGSFGFGSGDYTVFASAKAPAADKAFFAIGGQASTSGLLGLRYAGNNTVKVFTTKKNDACDDLLSVTLDDDPEAAYHTYAIVYDSSAKTLKLSVDGGAFTATASYTAGSGSQFQFGGIHGGAMTGAGNATTGAIDEFRLYTRQLSLDDVKSLTRQWIEWFVVDVSDDVAMSEVVFRNGLTPFASGAKIAFNTTAASTLTLDCDVSGINKVAFNGNAKLTIAQTNSKTLTTTSRNFEVNGTIAVPSATYFGAKNSTAEADRVTILIAEDGTMELTGNGVNDEQNIDYSGVTGTGTLRYCGTTGWFVLPNSGTKRAATTLQIVNEQQGGLILSQANVVTTIGTLSGSKGFRADWGNGNRDLEVVQAHNSTWGGTFGGDYDRIGTFKVSGADGATEKMLTITGTFTNEDTLEVTSSGSVNLTGAWKGPATVSGEIAGTGSISGAVTFNSGATLWATNGTLTAGSVTAGGVFTVKLPAGLTDEEIASATVIRLASAATTALRSQVKVISGDESKGNYFLKVAVGETEAKLEAISASGRVVSINFDSGDGAATDGWGLVAGTHWNNLPGNAGTAVSLTGSDGNAAGTVTWTSKNTYNCKDTGLGIDPALYGYLDDGIESPGPIAITVSGLPFAVYDVIVYQSSGDSNNRAFNPPMINGMCYSYDGSATSLTLNDASLAYGQSLNTTPAVGVNCAYVQNEFTGDLVINGGSSANSARGGIAAIQIIERTDITVYYGAIADGTGEINFSAIQWSPAKPDGGFTNEKDILVLTNFADNATIVFDEKATASKFKFRGAAGKNLTIGGITAEEFRPDIVKWDSSELLGTMTHGGNVRERVQMKLGKSTTFGGDFFGKILSAEAGGVIHYTKSGLVIDAACLNKAATNVFDNATVVGNLGASAEIYRTEAGDALTLRPTNNIPNVQGYFTAAGGTMTFDCGGAAVNLSAGEIAVAGGTVMLDGISGSGTLTLAGGTLGTTNAWAVVDKSLNVTAETTLKATDGATLVIKQMPSAEAMDLLAVQTEGTGKVVFLTSDRTTAVTVPENATIGYFEESINDVGAITVPYTENAVALIAKDGKSEIPVTSSKTNETDTITFYFTPRFEGKLCYWDYEFNEECGTEPQNSGTEGTKLTFDGNRPFQNNEYTADHELRLPVRPWRKDFTYPAPSTFAFYGTLPCSNNTYAICFGSTTEGTQEMLFFATGNAATREVRLVYYNNKTQEDPITLCTMTVPHNATAKHLYGVTLTENKFGNSVVNVYLDGELWQPYEFETKITLGSGFQIAGPHGGEGILGNKGYNRPADNDPAVMDFLRVYTETVSDEAMLAMAEQYPFINPLGEYYRDISDETNPVWDAEGKWIWSLGGTTNLPPKGCGITITNTTDKTLLVNTTNDQGITSLKIVGGGTLTMDRAANCTNKVHISGNTVADADVITKNFALDLNGGHVRVKTGRTVTFDMSGHALSNYVQNAEMCLAGYSVFEGEGDDKGKFAFTAPTGEAAAVGRMALMSYMPATGHYHMFVIVRLTTELAEGTTTWSTLTGENAGNYWHPNATEAPDLWNGEELPDWENISLHFTATNGTATVNFDGTAAKCYVLEVEGTNDVSLTGTLTVNSSKGWIDFRDAAGKVTVGFSTGAAKIYLGDRTEFTSSGTGTLVVEAGETAYVKIGGTGAWGGMMEVGEDGHIIFETADTQKVQSLDVEPGSTLYVATNTTDNGSIYVTGSGAVDLTGVKVNLEPGADTNLTYAAEGGTYNLVNATTITNDDLADFSAITNRGVWTIGVETVGDRQVLKATKARAIYVKPDADAGSTNVVDRGNLKDSLDIPFSKIPGSPETTEAAVNALNAEGANGMKVWASIVLGYDSTDEASRMTVYPKQTGNANEIQLYSPPITVDATTGASVTYSYESSDDRETWTHVKGAEGNDPETPTTLTLPSTGVKYYKLKATISTQGAEE